MDWKRKKLIFQLLPRNIDLERFFMTVALMAKTKCVGNMCIRFERTPIIHTFAVGWVRVPFSIITSHSILAFKGVFMITLKSNCFSVTIVITNVNTVFYSSRG